MSGIFYIDYYMPDNFMPVSDVIKKIPDYPYPEKYGSADDFCKEFRAQSNLDRIAIEEYKNLVEIFTDLLAAFFQKTHIEPEKIEHIFYTDTFNMTTQDYVYIPYYLQKKFNMRKASVMFLNQLCSATAWGMGIAQNLLSNSCNEKYVLILSSCFLHKFENRYAPSTIGGDAVGVLVLNTSSINIEIVDYIFLSDGTGSFNKYHKIDQQINKVLIVRNGVNAIKKLLQKNNLTLDDIFLIIPQSVNRYVYTMYENMLNIQSDKMFTKNIPNGGHLGDVDTIRNLKDCIDLYSIPDKSYIIVYGFSEFGTDVNYNLVLLKYNKN